MNYPVLCMIASHCSLRTRLMMEEVCNSRFPPQKLKLTDFWPEYNIWGLEHRIVIENIEQRQEEAKPQSQLHWTMQPTQTRTILNKWYR